MQYQFNKALAASTRSVFIRRHIERELQQALINAKINTKHV